MSLSVYDRDRIQHEIRWKENKILELMEKYHRKPSVMTEVNDLLRQIKENEVSLLFDDYAYYVPPKKKG